MTSNGKQFTVTREMLTAVARDQRWPDVAWNLSAFFRICFCFAYNKSLNDCSPRNQSLSVKYEMSYDHLAEFDAMRTW